MIYEIKMSIICSSACRVLPRLWAHACFCSLLHAPLMPAIHVAKFLACLWQLLHKV